MELSFDGNPKLNLIKAIKRTNAYPRLHPSTQMHLLVRENIQIPIDDKNILLLKNDDVITILPPNLEPPKKRVKLEPKDDPVPKLESPAHGSTH